MKSPGSSPDLPKAKSTRSRSAEVDVPPARADDSTRAASPVFRRGSRPSLTLARQENRRRRGPPASPFVDDRQCRPDDSLGHNAGRDVMGSERLETWASSFLFPPRAGQWAGVAPGPWRRLGAGAVFLSAVGVVLASQDLLRDARSDPPLEAGGRLSRPVAGTLIRRPYPGGARRARSSWRTPPDAVRRS